MTLFWSKAAVVATSLLFLPACSAAQTMAAPKPGAPASKVATAKPRKHATSKPPAAPAPQTQPLPPPAPLTPEQMPAAPPQVTYHNGLLSIVATNSTLSDILHAVSTRTGATVDAPAQLTRERVAARIGPATPREVLSDLLTGPRFDYILVGSDGDPNSVRSIILTANQSSPSAGAAMAQPPSVRAAMPPQVDDEESEDEPSPPQPATPPAQPAAQQASPGPRPFAPQQPPDQVGGPPPASGEGGQQVKSPEQLLEQLRRMQQPGNPPPDAR